jgi:gliding motility-associated-like protein
LNITSMQAVPSTTCQPDGSVVAFTSGVNGAPPTGTPANFWQDSLSYVNLPNGDSITASSWNNIGSGWYYFTVTDARCFDTDSIYVDQINPPIASFIANQTNGCAGMTVLFANNSQNTTYFEWDFGNGNTATDNTLAAHSEQYFTSATVTLTAYLDATKTCSNSTTIYIDVVPCGCTDPNALNYDPNALVETGDCIYPFPIVLDPNVFTPNGDGENDLFFFKTEYTVEFKLTITNRWGNVVYDKILDLTAPIGPQGWDGKAQNGNEAKSGTYFYKYTAIGINGDELNGKGFVQLVRD